MSIVSNITCSNVEEDFELRRGPWTLEEDTLLIRYISCHGEGRWNFLAKCSGLKRTGKSCRLRWLNYLKPDIKRGNLTLEEQTLIVELHSKWGNRWSRIARYLPGRTDNEIKNYWRTKVQKHLKIDANGTRFRDALRCFGMPRLLQKIEHSSSSSSSNSQTEYPLTTLVQNQGITVSYEPPPPHTSQESFSMSEPINILSYPEKNLSLEKGTSPSFYSSDSVDMSHIPEISEYPTSPHAFGSIGYDPVQKGYYNIGTTSCCMEEFNMAFMPALEGLDSSVPDIQYGLWSMDELWQFR